MRSAIPIIGLVVLACGEMDEGRPFDDGHAGGFRGETADATVAWTNGDGLNVRAWATRASTRVDWLPEGAAVTIVCQVEGESVGGSDLWDRLEAPAGYVLDRYMRTGYADWIPGVPECGEAGDEIVVAGWAVTAQERHWLEYVGREVVPRLSGSRQSRLTTAARVAWWSLKEGVLGLDDALEYSNCNFPSGDAHIGPVDGCPAGRAWQVGLAASQVPWPYVDVDATALALHPGQSIEDVLWWTATEAGFDPSTSDVGAAIVASMGDLRTSWLLRNPAVGFTNEVEVVTAECIDDSKAWCFGTGWDTTARYAPDRATAMGAIDDLYAAFDRLAP
jgi:hypothetical protein